MWRPTSTGYIFLIFILFAVIIQSASQSNNEVVDIWHTKDFIALSRPGDTSFKKCLLKTKKIHVIYCNKYNECDPNANTNTIDVIYVEKSCGENLNFDEKTLQCKPSVEVDCHNRL